MESYSNLSDDLLREQLALVQRTRTLALWHDHSTILLTGYIIFAVWVIYDIAVFLTPEEYLQRSCRQVKYLQVVYMIAPSSSSPSDQLSLIGDGLECITGLSQMLSSSCGIVIRDELRSFVVISQHNSLSEELKLVVYTNVEVVAARI